MESDDMTPTEKGDHLAHLLNVLLAVDATNEVQTCATPDCECREDALATLIEFGWATLAHDDPNDPAHRGAYVTADGFAWVHAVNVLARDLAPFVLMADAGQGLN